jgi:hypothetical protein
MASQRPQPRRQPKGTNRYLGHRRLHAQAYRLPEPSADRLQAGRTERPARKIGSYGVR